MSSAYRFCPACAAPLAAAFRQLAHGAPEQAAHGATVAFYRATGHGWTKQLG